MPRLDEQRRGRVRQVLRLVVVVAALVTGLAAVIVAARVPGAPVDSTTSTVTWPQAGKAPTPTTLFLVPYRPAALEATVPCTAIRAARARPDPTTLLATTTGAPQDALVVRTARGDAPAAGNDDSDRAAPPLVLQVLLSGRLVPVDVPTTDCTLTIAADVTGARITVGDPTGPPAVTFPGDPVPEVFAATTDLTGADADGLALSARTPAWFDNAPTPAKSQLIGEQYRLAAVALLLVVLARLLTPTPGSRTLTELGARRGRRARALLRARGYPLARRGLAVARRPWVLARLAIDAAVIGGLGWWSIIGPLTDDDGFASVIARQIGRGATGDTLGGDVTNYYRWYDASEVPFASGQRLLAMFMRDDLGALTLSPVGLRLPSVLMGVLTWFLVTRGVLRPALGPAGRSVWVRLLAALALAVWWMPYCLGTRPEPYVAAGTTAVTVLLLRAARGVGREGGDVGPRRLTQPAAWLALAVLVAGLTVTVAPSGLIAAAPFALLLPRLLRAVRGDGPAREPGVVARATRLVLPVAHLAVVAGLAAATVAVVFTHQSWHGFLVSTDIHQQLGPNQPWYAEWLRYSYLFGEDSWGAAGKRVPVIVGLVLSGLGLVLLARGGGREGTRPLGREATLLLGLLPAGFALMAVTPSKWSHHFGALAGYGVVGIVAVVVTLARAVRRTDPVVAAAGAVATLVLALGAAFAFTGPNAWWGYSGWNLAGSTGPQVPWNSPVRWVAIALLVAVVAVVVLAALAWARRPAAPEAAPVPDDDPADDDLPHDDPSDDHPPDDRPDDHPPDGHPPDLDGGVLSGALPDAAPGQADRAPREHLRDRLRGASRDGLVGAAAATPAVTAVVIAATSVVLLGTTFSAAGDQGSRYSLASQNRAAIADPASAAACGLQSRVQVLQTVPGGPLTPVAGSTATMSGFVADGGAMDPPPLRPGETDGTDGTPDTRAGRYSWGSRDGGDSTVGDLTTPWFGLNRPTGDQELAIDVAGRTDEGMSLTWEFGRGDGDDTDVVGTVPVREAPQPDRGYMGYAANAAQAQLQDEAQEDPRWRTLTLRAPDLPAGADRVRLRATDDRTGTGGWIAVTGPRVVDVEPLSRWLADHQPVIVDWAVAFAWPCTGDPPAVTDGVAQTPGAMISSPKGPPDPGPGDRTTDVGPAGDIVPERWASGIDGLATGSDVGGSFAGLADSASLRELDTRLPDDPTRRWGRVLVPYLDKLDADAYDVRRTTTTQSGTAGDPSPAVNPQPVDGLSDAAQQSTDR